MKSQGVRERERKSTKFKAKKIAQKRKCKELPPGVRKRSAKPEKKRVPSSEIIPVLL
jgi:hypothetical protein